MAENEYIFNIPTLPSEVSRQILEYAKEEHQMRLSEAEDRLQHLDNKMQNIQLAEREDIFPDHEQINKNIERVGQQMSNVMKNIIKSKVMVEHLRIMQRSLDKST